VLYVHREQNFEFDQECHAALRRHEFWTFGGGKTVPLNQLPQRSPAFDATRRYVRFRELRSDGYVLFDFAIGDPEIAVELVLTLPAYQEFCRTNAVTWLTRAQADAVDIENSKWRFGAPGLHP